MVFYSSCITDEDIEAKRAWLREKEITYGVKISECQSQPRTCGGSGFCLLPGHLCHGHPEGTRLMYRHVCVVMGPQEAFNKCLPAKQELHQATQKTSGKMRIKPKSTLKPVFIYHWALLPWVGQKASTSHRGEYVSIPPIQRTAREAPASAGFVGTTFEHPEGTKPRRLG